ncbi:hypothetical protein NDU88_003364 [Pleurodeles waltl]|uniref:Uncharacterized protein n=1 Tax=Pleurodeles waltl TaxID=8319 RepID=A0AAV7RH67_PLEWA|nr:hypothetical protein NDU88_003364 [Pleurodeles waltl]
MTQSSLAVPVGACHADKHLSADLREAPELPVHMWMGLEDSGGHAGGNPHAATTRYGSDLILGGGWDPPEAERPAAGLRAGRQRLRVMAQRKIRFFDTTEAAWE